MPLLPAPALAFPSPHVSLPRCSAPAAYTIAPSHPCHPLEIQQQLLHQLLASSHTDAMGAPATSFGSRLLLLEPAMGFGSAPLVLTPAGVVGARLPAEVRAAEGSAAASSHRGSVILRAMPMWCGARRQSTDHAPLRHRGSGRRVIVHTPQRWPSTRLVLCCALLPHIFPPR